VLTISSVPVRRAAFKSGARCDLCPLRDSKSPAVPPAKSKTPALKLILVGEGPGRSEEKLGEPFRGMSGKLLDEYLTGSAKISRNSVYITNAALCRSPDGKKHEDEAAAVCCAPRLLSELSQLPPEVPIVVLGAGALRSLLGTAGKGIILSRGFIWRAPEIDEAAIKSEFRAALKFDSKSQQAKEHTLKAETLAGRARLTSRLVLPMLHPAFILRSELWHAIGKLDFKRIGRLLRGEIDLKQLADTPAPDELTVTQDVRKCYRLGSSISLDVETTRAASVWLAKLLCVGMSDGKRTVVLWPWSAKLAKPLGKFLRTRKEIVGHSLVAFDKPVLERHGVC